MSATCYDTVIKGVGGLPLGVEGTFVALVSGGIDSPGRGVDDGQTGL